VIPISRKIHPTAIVHPGAEIGANVEIGPYSIIGENVRIAEGTIVGPHVVIDGWTTIGRNNRIYAGVQLGIEPQDLKFQGEQSYLVIGDHNRIREYATITRGTEGGGGETRLGNDNLVMTYAHVDHDCQVGSHCVIVHGAALGGHVVIEDHVTVGGLAGIHQFTKIGRMAMIGACTKVVKDVPPFVTVDGHPARVVGINVVGLRRKGVPQEVRAEVKRAYKILYRSDLNVTQAIEQMENQLEGHPEIDHFIRFIRSAERGICR
jgi:UDP-N-acetylglucosamine acyltransferase